MKLSVIASAAFAAVASAQAIISVSSPLSGTVYTAGQQAIITWNSPTVQTISQIVLAQGASSALQPITVIATNVNAAAGQYTWTIPASTPAGADYAFEFGTSPNLAFAGPFTIKAGDGSASNSTSSAPAASSGAASTAAPSGAASSAPASSGAAKPSGSASGSAPASSPSSGANSLVAGSALAVGAAVVAAAQLF
ncbi:hypothetical protein DM01DRAFT_1334760 [Hesseltinella vesiculosa]|uniref:Yeast cell wall synthesis Kre9/Knh1-like N-terminal domain-containing protein n=1 Tax=Hesseltinella vesiculosa TaxID=101127 RepID=A0A1X2GM84_9FUNG|nr:hypothetical protein DM01DRAFT_1334760 [Hesseltinella vesiculosa]